MAKKAISGFMTEVPFDALLLGLVGDTQHTIKPSINYSISWNIIPREKWPAILALFFKLNQISDIMNFSSPLYTIICRSHNLKDQMSGPFHLKKVWFEFTL
jgi:hypothetical protein